MLRFQTKMILLGLLKMNEIKNEQQDRVLNLTMQSGIVSASAGSGKTRTMVKKILSYITGGTSVENILALTFTNQAGSEMKQRLVAELGKYIEETKRTELLDQLELIPEANISTFHSFYEKIVRKYFYIVGINPSFQILESQENVNFKDEAFDEAILKLKNKSFEKYLELRDVLGKKRKEESIRQKIFKLDSFLDSQFDSNKWLYETAISMYQNKDEMFQNFFGEYYSLIRQTQKEFDYLIEKANEDEEICKYASKCNLILNELLKSDFKTFYDMIMEGICFPKLLKSKAKFPELAEKAKQIKENFQAQTKQLKELGSFENVILSFESCFENIQLLIELYNDFKNFLKEKKNKENKFDFSDMESFCYEILKNDEIRNEIKSQTLQIFVDEFQDINPIQFEILKIISKENNVLYVGDAKQSIYAFRQSDVEIFSNVCKNFENNEFAQALLLTCNFRTNKKILDFVNEVFRILMTQNSCEIDYEKTSMFEGKSENSCQGASVEIVGVVKESQENKEKAERIFKIFETKRNFGDVSLEAKVVERKIEQLLEEKITIDGQTREVNFGDIAILFKKRSKLFFELKNLFSKKNIPFVVNDEIDLLGLKETKLALSFLNLCLNRKDDENLVVVLSSPIGKLSYDELSKIKLETNKDFFFERIEEYINKFDDEISIKLENFNKLLDETNFQIQTKGIALALEKALEKTGVFDLSLLLGKENLEKINQLISYIENSGLNSNLPELCEFFEKASEIKIPSVVKNNENAISILTIHASKGLEFPVVMLADAGASFVSTKFAKDDLRIDKNFGLAIKNYNKSERCVYESIFKLFIENNSKKKALAENLRLLYVALTRAKNKLVICGTLQDEIEQISKETNLLFCKQNYLSLILGVVQNKKIDGTKIEFVSQCDEKKFFKQNNFQDLSPILYAREKAKRFFYPNLESTKLALKTSVSNILTEFNSFESVSSLPEKFVVGEHLTNLSAKDEGTIVHELLEKVDFNGENVEKNVKNLLKNVNLTETQKNYICYEVVENSKILKSFVGNDGKIYKEKQFMIYASPKEIFGNGSEEKLLIQGRIDFVCVGEKTILIDYKNTNLSDEKKIIQKYRKQLVLYRFAIEKALGRKVDEIYILCLKQKKLVEII